MHFINAYIILWLDTYCNICQWSTWTTIYLNYFFEIPSIRITQIQLKKLLLLLYAKIKAILTRGEDVARNRNTRHHFEWTVGIGDPMHKVCIQQKIPRAWKHQGKRKNNSKWGVRYLEEMKVGDRMKQGLASAKVQTIMLTWGRDSNHKSVTNNEPNLSHWWPKYENN